MFAYEKTLQRTVEPTAYRAGSLRCTSYRFVRRRQAVGSPGIWMPGLRLVGLREAWPTMEVW